MENEGKIENGKGVIYHELGHLLTYRLSNKNPNTDLGHIAKFQTGLKVNCVIPINRLYHFKNPLKQKLEIHTNTSNIDRTLAWFIEVIAGCTFQTSYEDDIPFKYCFGPEKDKIGSRDFDNLNVIRPLSSFKWTFNDIYEIQRGFKSLIKNHSLLDKLKPIVADIIKSLIKSPENQIVFENEKLNHLTKSIDKIITENLLIDYLKLINKYKQKIIDKAIR